MAAGPCSCIWRATGHAPPPVELVYPAPAPASSQSVSQQWARLPHGPLCKRSSNKGKPSDTAEEQTGTYWNTSVSMHREACAPLIEEPPRPRTPLLVHVSLRAQLWCRASARRPVTSEGQQRSGGMILRRGSVVAAFLLCFLAKVRGLLSGGKGGRQRDGGHLVQLF